jgi:hypothetical protein
MNWFSQRLQDLSAWPINLVRDLPRRTGRVGQSALNAAQGVLFFLPELLDALRYNEAKAWARFKAGRTIFWSHGLLAQLFDLVSGPELIQFLMRPLAHATALTPDEIASVSAVLGPKALRFREVRVLEGGLFDYVFRLNGNLAFAAWRTVCLPASGPHTRADRSILVHELTHVYQYERVGTRYLGEAIYMLLKTQRDCYSYGGRAGLTAAERSGVRYRDFNREQQAMITQDFYALRDRGEDVTAYEPFIRQLRAGQL